MIRIRRTHDHDDEIQDLDRALFSPKDAPALQIPPTADTWVALDGEEVVGYLVAHAGDRGVHYLDRYGVHPDAAGQGIGQRLLRAWLRVVDRFQEPGSAFAWTYTSADNAQSINALFRAGFKAWRPEVLPTPWNRRPEHGWNIWRRACR